jgi:sugar phosphate isomerase/epimerase
MAPPLSIQLYTVREQAKDGHHADVLSQIGRIGYKAVEAGGTYGLSLREFRRLVEDCGMSVSGRFGPIPTRDNASEIIDALGQLGTDLAIGGFWEKDFDSVDAVKRTAGILREGVALLAQRGVTFCMHNHWMEYRRLEGRLATDWLVELCPELKLEIDTYWAANFGAEDPVAIVRAHRDRTPLLHLKDGAYHKDDMTPAGSGKQDFVAIMAAANPAVLRFGVLEIDEVPGEMMQAVEQSYRFLVGRGLCEGNRPVA